MHASITVLRLVRAIKRSHRDCDYYPGICISCGRSAKQNCEADAENYPCQFQSCKQLAVYGAEQLLFMMHP